MFCWTFKASLAEIGYVITYTKFVRFLTSVMALGYLSTDYSMPCVAFFYGMSGVKKLTVFIAVITYTISAFETSFT